jgi:hypothetical protein
MDDSDIVHIAIKHRWRAGKLAFTIKHYPNVYRYNVSHLPLVSLAYIILALTCASEHGAWLLSY